jgi:predicted transcriptional regulator
MVEQHGERCCTLSELSTQLSTLKEATDLTEQCRMQAIYLQLDEEDRETLKRVLKGNTSTRKIHQVLRQNGHRIDRNLLSLHRKGFCTCKDGK